MKIESDEFNGVLLERACAALRAISEAGSELADALEAFSISVYGQSPDIGMNDAVKVAAFRAARFIAELLAD